MQQISETTLISCYSLTNIAVKEEIENFYIQLTSKQIIQNKYPSTMSKDQDEILRHKLDSVIESRFITFTNTNAFMFKNIHENNLFCLNTQFQKRSGQFWTYKSPSGNNAQLHYIIIKKKGKNSAKNLNYLIRFSASHQTTASPLHRSIHMFLKLLFQS